MNNTIEQIIQNSNYEEASHVEQAIEDGHIEIYESKKEYEKAGYDFTSPDYYHVLEDGGVVYFVGG